MANLDFSNSNTLYATHGIHAFAAKCPPQLVDYGLRYYSKKGELVLDPMMGSGTTLAEARINGRNSIGVDIDPLSYLIAKVKSTSLNVDALDGAFDQIFRLAKEDIELVEVDNAPGEIDKRSSTKDFYNKDYWFLPSVANSLSILKFHISNVDISNDIRDFFWLVLSSLILAKTSVANARDITHSRHHYIEHKEPPDVLDKFRLKYRRMRRMMVEFYELSKDYPDVTAKALLGDARSLPIEDASIDLVFTSPPYATALDYTRAHFLAIPWLEDRLGITFNQYKRHGAKYIGSQRGRLPASFQIDPCFSELLLSKQALEDLLAQSERHAKLVQRYLLEMYSTLVEISRVLRQKKKAIIVVCPSNIRKVQVPTNDIFIEMGRTVGLVKKYSHVRTIDKQKRLMPYIKESFGPRMSTEYVLVFEKE